MARPQTRYAKSGDANIAYQVVGDGPLDLVCVPGWISNVERIWDEPSVAQFLGRLFDKRGTGLSDRGFGHLTLENRMDDVRSIMDAVGSKRAAVLGMSEGGNMRMLFAATYPELTSALVLFGCFARGSWAADYTWGTTPAEQNEWNRHWGGSFFVSKLTPSRAGDLSFTTWFSSYLRMGASPRDALMFSRASADIDVRHTLPAIRVPTLVMHRRGDLSAHVEEGRYIAERVVGAKFVELEGEDHNLWAGDMDSVAGEVEEFLTGTRQIGHDIDRVLTTLLFTDVVGSTERAAALGDRRWCDLLARHDAVVRLCIERHRGREAKMTGDGFVAHFDNPARAVRCALDIVEAVRALGLEIRAGVHTGECHVRGDDLTGITVHVAARVAALGGAGEVVASSMVKDLVAGAGLAFIPRGVHALKGVPGEWELFTASLPSSADGR